MKNGNRYSRGGEVLIVALTGLDVMGSISAAFTSSVVDTGRAS
jgi:hypothetical protein